MDHATRRGLLGALAVTPLLALPAVAAIAAPTPDKPSTWAEAYAAYLRAKEEDDAYDRAVWSPAYEATERLISEVPHHEVAFVSQVSDSIKVMSTAVPHDISGAEGMLRALPDAQTDYMIACRELVAAHGEREAEIRRIRTLPAMREADDRTEALSEAKWFALKAVS